MEGKKVTSGNITSGSLCDFYGWGGNNNKLRKVSNLIIDAIECGTNAMTNVKFCTMMSPTFCNRFYGSPVICVGDQFSGIILPDNCTNQNLYSIVSLDNYIEWIEDVTGKAFGPPKSSFLIVALLSIMLVAEIAEI